MKKNIRKYTAVIMMCIMAIMMTFQSLASDTTVKKQGIESIEILNSTSVLAH